MAKAKSPATDTAPSPWKVTKHGRNVFAIDVEYRPARGWERRFLLSSDRHWDNPDSDHRMQLAHLKEAAECDAGILDFGDLFCAMQGKYDPRSSKRNIREEHQTDNYLDSLVSTAAHFFGPYARNWIVAGMGNHETAILKRCESNLTDRFVDAMNARGGNLFNGGYKGWVRFQFRHPTAKEPTVLLHYEHGHGGGGAVTKGVIQTNRRGVYLPDANIVVSGHVHEQWMLALNRHRITQRNELFCDTQWHVCLPTYKEEFNDGYGGFHIEKGRPPKPLGAAWLIFYFSRRDDRVKYKIEWAE